MRSDDFRALWGVRFERLVDALNNSTGDAPRFVARFFASTPSFFRSVLSYLSPEIVAHAFAGTPHGSFIGPDLLSSDLVVAANARSPRSRNRRYVCAFDARRLHCMRYKLSMSMSKLRVLCSDLTQDFADVSTMDAVRHLRAKLLLDCGTLLRLVL